ncbi:YkgJ family cysteine cluster protein [Methanococcoides seepicolus]|uniref:YkgJ family cysteine cluster protein n=1 Tax=Methanococcoides seepicolus TaxID=2828780 RepID=A0A9E4ZCI5_9EURY|nr:YkgJ family cysteine cluster protein [Methanococcoides seepicolus]MCM1985627.1 YkgJ family cysteine cluster protein [Methanococcoides seepicolus]
MFSDYRQRLVNELKEELEAAENISCEDLASQIRSIGFTCSMCGKCCRRSCGDNRVFLTSSDIRSLQDCSLDDAVFPMLPDMSDVSFADAVNEYSHELEVDSQGRYHTFGWMLKRKANGNCSFIGEDGSNRCGIYGSRPMLCGTYPFYVECGKLLTSECEGLGKPISDEDAVLLAKGLLDRYVTELKDTVLLYEKFEANDASSHTIAISKGSSDVDEVLFIVHDHNGNSEFAIKLNK